MGTSKELNATSVEDLSTPRSPAWQRVLGIKPVRRPPASMDDAEELPEASANWLSKLVFWWLNDHMLLGYRRTLEPEDLYKMDHSKQAATLAAKLEASWSRRLVIAEEHNQAVRARKKHPSTWQSFKWMLKRNATRKHLREQWYESDGLRSPDLKWATNDMLGPSVFNRFWAAAVFRILADALQATAPIVMRHLIDFLEVSYRESRSGGSSNDTNIGKGVGLAVGLFAMQLTATICTSQFFYLGSSSGVLFRAGLMKALYDRAVAISPAARAKIPNSKLYAHTIDIGRIDFACNFFMACFSAPFQICLCLALLIVNLRYSALPGFAVFLMIFPVQNRITKMLFEARKKCVAWSDQRAKLVSEMLSGIRIVKSFSYERPFIKKLFELRKHELIYVRRILVARAGNISIAFSLPVLGAVVSFVVYKSTGHDLTPGIIFSSLSLFQLLRQPLMLLPQALNAATDAKNSFDRLTPTFLAEKLPEKDASVQRDPTVGVKIENATFTWESGKPPEPFSVKNLKKMTGKKQDKVAEAKKDNEAPKEPFKIENLNLRVEPGEMIALVGAVGSGKSSLLNGLIGEMRKVKGTLAFGGKIAYIPQTPWCFNGTVRENILFGQPYEAKRYQQCLEHACLLDDLKLFDYGDLTEIGENGITLSGGQKQRVNIARALYFDADVILADDCFSALDGQVGQSIFNRAFKHSLKGSTVILATHALHLLPQVDRVVFFNKGTICAEGTFDELMARDTAFAALINDFGTSDQEQTTDTKADSSRPGPKQKNDADGPSKQTKALMSQEERETGSVDWKVYSGYFKHAKGKFFLPLLAITIVITQGAIVMSSYWLVFWQEMEFKETQGFYMGIYAGIAVAATVLTFILGAIFSLMSVEASSSLHAATFKSVIFAPLSFFDTTPVGRIISRLTKDVDTIDNVLSDSMRMFVLMASNMMGGLIIIIIVVPWFAIATVVLLFLLYILYRFYASSAREVKRLDSILRSALYAHLAESLSGLSTIRAYGRVQEFSAENARLVDVEDRAYYLTSVNQRYIGIRIDMMASVLTLIVALISVGERTHISPAQLGLSLSFIVPLQQAFSFVVRQFTLTESNLNSAERLLFYADKLDQEAPYERPDVKIASNWPPEGHIEFKSVSMAYRPGLPLVLKGLTFSVQPGEAIGICGRTGAGKSSILLCLLRLVEVSGGQICIDGQDISQLGLELLRQRIALIPQDPLLFEGTIRSNLDPFSVHDDATLNRALQRARVLDEKRSTKLNLDTTITEGGQNLSVGERSLLSLARALVKDSKVIMLDEASASLDFETDADIQDTILSQFSNRTLLCIAHRLKTIIGYSRILMMDQGQVEAFDEPLRLWENSERFRSMCASNGIGLTDIEEAQAKRLRLQQ